MFGAFPLDGTEFFSQYFGTVSQASLLDKVEGELLAVNDLINKSPNFASFLGNPTISRQEKANKVRAVPVLTLLYIGGN